MSTKQENFSFPWTGKENYALLISEKVNMLNRTLPHVILMLADDLGFYELGYKNPGAVTHFASAMQDFVSSDYFKEVAYKGIVEDMINGSLEVPNEVIRSVDMVLRGENEKTTMEAAF